MAGFSPDFVGILRIGPAGLPVVWADSRLVHLVTLAVFSAGALILAWIFYHRTDVTDAARLADMRMSRSACLPE
jgi:hypothetical protein